MGAWRSDEGRTVFLMNFVAPEAGLDSFADAPTGALPAMGAAHRPVEEAIPDGAFAAHDVGHDLAQDRRVVVVEEALRVWNGRGRSDFLDLAALTDAIE